MKVQVSKEDVVISKEDVVRLDDSSPVCLLKYYDQKPFMVWCSVI